MANRPRPRVRPSYVMGQIEFSLQRPVMVLSSFGSQVIGHQPVGAEIREPQTEGGLAAKKRGRLHGSPPVNATVGMMNWPRRFLNCTCVSPPYRRGYRDYPLV